MAVFLNIHLRCYRSAKKRGILVVVATAGFWFKVEKYLDIILPDYAILADGTQIYHKGEMIHGYPMDELQCNGIISELLRKNAEHEFVVSVGKKLLCSATGNNEKWRVSGDFTEPMKDSAYKIAGIIDSYKEAKGLAEKYVCRFYSYRGEQLYGFASEQLGKYQAVAKYFEKELSALTSIY